jgi:MotA/TolQ/ExbB proton channel family
MPFLAAVLIAVATPADALRFYLERIRSSYMDWLILGLGFALFVLQIVLSWRAMHWRGTQFDERPDRWLSNLAQAAEWFPLLGLIGTVAGILQTFSQITGQVPPERIIQLYAPAITATGSGLFMALFNILPTWVVLIGRDLIRSLGGEMPAPAAPADAKPFSQAVPDGRSTNTV